MDMVHNNDRRMNFVTLALHTKLIMITISQCLLLFDDCNHFNAYLMANIGLRRFLTISSVLSLHRHHVDFKLKLICLLMICEDNFSIHFIAIIMISE